MIPFNRSKPHSSINNPVEVSKHEGVRAVIDDRTPQDNTHISARNVTVQYTYKCVVTPLEEKSLT